MFPRKHVVVKPLLSTALVPCTYTLHFHASKCLNASVVPACSIAPSDDWLSTPNVPHPLCRTANLYEKPHSRQYIRAPFKYSMPCITSIYQRHDTTPGDKTNTPQFFFARVDILGRIRWTRRKVVNYLYEKLTPREFPPPREVLSSGNHGKWTLPTTGFHRCTSRRDI